MKPPETNDPLDALLRENDGYIEDHGFTSRVVAELPRRRRTWLRSAILFGAAVIGFALVTWWLPPMQEIFVTDPNGGLALQFTTQTLLTMGTLAVALGSVVWGVVAAVKED